MRQADAFMLLNQDKHDVMTLILSVTLVCAPAGAARATHGRGAQQAPAGDGCLARRAQRRAHASTRRRAPPSA